MCREHHVWTDRYRYMERTWMEAALRFAADLLRAVAMRKAIMSSVEMAIRECPPSLAK